MSSDAGNEFFRDFEKACAETAATHIVNSVLIKNANKSESSNSRLVNLARRELENARDWPDQIQKIVFSLNCTSMKYGDFVCTPNMLFNGRCITGVPSIDEDVEKTVLKSSKTIRQLMTEVSRSRLLDTPSLSMHLQNRPQAYHVGQKVLVWAEQILAKKLLKNGILKIKLSKFWRVATVTKALGDHYMVQMEDGQLRRTHRRQMKVYPL